MNNYSIYNPQTGSIDKILTLQDPIENNLETPPYYIEGEFSGATQYVNVETKEVIDMPPKPGIEFIFDYYTKQWVIDENIAKHYVEEQRQKLLKESDWVVIRAMDTGTPIPNNWQVYRQALRDIDKQPGYPSQVSWPTLAEGI